MKFNIDHGDFGDFHMVIIDQEFPSVYEYTCLACGWKRQVTSLEFSNNISGLYPHDMQFILEGHRRVCKGTVK